MIIPDDLKYTKEHEWVRIEGNVAVVGITDHAQSELGDIVYIDIPNDINTVRKDESFGTIEAVKTVADIFAPLSGKIISVNRSINDNPEVVNKDPYGAGWIIKIEFSNKEELDELLTAEQYKQLIGQ